MTDGNLSAGAGKARIDIPGDAWPLDGFVGERDPLWVRTLVLDVAARRSVICVLDQTALPPATLEKIRECLTAATGVAGADLLVVASHTFAAPHLVGAADAHDRSGRRMPDAFAAMLAAVDSSARGAVDGLAAARLASGMSSTSVAVNRDVEVGDGWTIGQNPAAFAESSLPILTVETTNGSPVAVLVNGTVQSSVLADRTGTARRSSADLAGATVERIEAAVPGCVALFLVGAAGDQAPAVASPSHPEASLGALADQLAGAALLGRRTAVELDSSTIVTRAGVLAVPGQHPVDRLAFVPTRTHVYRPSGTQELPYGITVIGEFALVGVQVELSAETGAQLRARSPFRATMVVTMVNGGAKYLPPVDAFDRMTYEAQSSRYARGSAEILRDAVLADLNSIAAASTAARSETPA